MDLISHEYVEEVTQQVEQESDGADGEPTAKKQKTMEKETKSVKKAMSAWWRLLRWTGVLSCMRRGFAGWTLPSSCFRFSLTSSPRLATPPDQRRGRPTWPSLRRCGTRPWRSCLSPSVRYQTRCLVSFLVLTFNLDLISYFPADLLFAELSPVCAIVGGVLAQEVIKAISYKDAPHNNYYFYNPLESCGVVETIGY